MKIKAKVLLGLPLTEHERAVYLLLIASEKEMHKYLQEEQKHEKNHSYDSNCCNSTDM